MTQSDACAALREPDIKGKVSVIADFLLGVGSVCQGAQFRYPALRYFHGFKDAPQKSKVSFHGRYGNGSAPDYIE